jgi:hypothetical protein
MSDMANYAGQFESSTIEPVTPQMTPTPPTDFKLEERNWGYIVGNHDGAGLGVYIAQGASMLVGASFIAAAIGLVAMPSTGDTLIMRSGVAVLFAGVAALFLWYASRGTETELQIDTRMNEVREVVRNRSGKPTLLGRYGFENIGGVFVDHFDDTDDAALIMRYRNTPQTLLVAQGTPAILSTLKNRIQNDLRAAA